MVELASSFSLGEINSLSQLEYLKWQEVLSRFMMQLRKQLIHLAQSFGFLPWTTSKQQLSCVYEI